LLNKCDPAGRRNMYEALKPNLRFEAKPLDVYLADIAIDAEARQLPTVDPSSGQLKPFRVAEISGPLSDEAQAQEAVNQAFAKQKLIVTCRSCTRQEQFTGDTKADAVFNARLAGWVYYEKDGVPREICPDCPASAPQRTMTVS
jgi:hypothetical protein